MDAWGRRHASDRLVLCLLGLGVTAAYLAFERGSLGAWDGRSMASVARNLLEHHSLKECCNAFGAFPLDRGPYSKFAIGFSLVLVPFWYLQLHVDPTGTLWLGVANPLLLAAGTVVIAKVGLLLGWRRSTAVLAALAFAFATMAPVYSTEFFAEPGVTFAVMLVILGLVLWPSVPQRGALALGAGVMTAILFRFDSVLLVAPAVLCAPLFHSRQAFATTWKRVAVPLGLPIAIAVTWTLFYNHVRFGHAFQFGYSGVYDRAGFSTPLLRGIELLLVSPGQSLFLYAPVLLAALPGVVWLARRRSHVAAAIVLLCVLRVLFFARWWTPAGGDGWGPRFLLPLCALLAVPLGETLEHVHLLRGLRKWSAVSVISVLAAASLAVQYASIAVPYAQVYALLSDLRGVPAPQRATVLAQRMHRFNWTFGQSHIVWNFRHVTALRFASVYWPPSGPRPFGVAMLALAFLACGTAVALAPRPAAPPAD